VTVVDWDRYQKCSQVCGAELGKPCVETSGFAVGVGPIVVEAAEPHSPRELRAGREAR
jgi:hypothetical protein